MKKKSQKGFTLIELLTVVSTLMVLASVSMQTFREYKAKAAYTVALRSYRDARGALEASFAQPDAVFADVATSQRSPGALVDGNARALLSALRLPKSLRFSVEHSQSCTDSSCIQTYLEAKHCNGIEYVAWTRFGDGIEIVQERVAGAGCDS
jgi:prepilin-type N-terminal cleavage/methylation domain-containing protein